VILVGRTLGGGTGGHLGESAWSRWGKPVVVQVNVMSTIGAVTCLTESVLVVVCKKSSKQCYRKFVSCSIPTVVFVIAFAPPFFPAKSLVQVSRLRNTPCEAHTD